MVSNPLRAKWPLGRGEHGEERQRPGAARKGHFATLKEPEALACELRELSGHSAARVRLQLCRTQQLPPAACRMAHSLFAASWLSAPTRTR